MHGMGRILSGRNRERDIADPKSGGAKGRYRRRHMMRDIDLTFADLETMLRMSPDERLKRHVREHIAKIAPLAGVGAGAVPAGATASGEGGGTAGAGDAAGASDRDGEYGAGVEILEDDLEKEVWGD